MAKKIKLTQGKYAVVDDADFENLNKHKWRAHVRIGKNGVMEYVAIRYVYMHTEILTPNTSLKGKKIIHLNGNSLNMTRDNLQLGKSSSYIGVFRKKSKGARQIYYHWTACIEIRKKGKRITLFCQRFPDTPTGEKAAALAYNEAARKHFGNNTELNNVPED